MRTVKTDQTGWMPRLIKVFAWSTHRFVGFVMRRLNYDAYISSEKRDPLEAKTTPKIYIPDSA